MITREKRRMTPGELGEIERLERNWRRTVGCVGCIALTAALTAAGVGGVAGASMGQSYPGELVRFVGTGAVAGVIAVVWVFFGTIPRRNRGLAVDGLDQEVEVLRVTASAAVRAGEGFAIDVGGGELLWLRGPYLAHHVLAGRFPCSSFTLVQSPTAWITLRLDCGGLPLPAPPLEPVPPMLGALADGTIFPRSSVPIPLMGTTA